MLEGQLIFSKMNQLGESKVPFFFMIDFLKEKGKAVPLSQLEEHNIQFNINSSSIAKKDSITLEKTPINLEEYGKAFTKVKVNLQQGNSYLTNLTFSTPISINKSLIEVYKQAKAKYKLWYNNEFVCFSPETFVKIKSNNIYSYPMKGTIDARKPKAEETILSSAKETAEHYTIVDLIRNDLSQVAKKVTVNKLRYVEKIKTNEQELLQVSSEVTGKLPQDYYKSIGDIFNKLLPAGSISGAPKRETLDIILSAEQAPRNFYTGVFGVFDGQDLDSAVMIRFIENTPKGMVYKSGGGITHLSQLEDEYQEMIQKIYVPIY